MTQQTQTRHRGDFAGANYSQELRGSERLWVEMPKPTEAELAAFGQGATEAKALLVATGGDERLMQKFLAHRREEQQVAIERKALGFTGPIADSAHPYSLVRQGARGPFIDQGDNFGAHRAQFQSKGRHTGDFYYHLARLRGEIE